MEVHAHTHTARKKWTHYLWEFLMLFLAVFCGFLAENIREHRVENNRANEYAKSLINDLYEDTVQLKVIESEGPFSASGIDSLRDVYLAGDSDPAYNAKLYWYADFTVDGLEFIQHDATLRQLLSSGNLRYFHRTDLVNNITYYNWLIGSMRDIQERDRITNNAAKSLHGKIFDTFDVLAVVAFEQFKGIQTLRQQQTNSHIAHRPAFFDSGNQSAAEIHAQRQFQLVDAAGLGAVIPEQQGEIPCRLHLRRHAQLVRISSQSMHDMGNGQLARATHDAVVARGAHPHGV